MPDQQEKIFPLLSKSGLGIEGELPGVPNEHVKKLKGSEDLTDNQPFKYLDLPSIGSFFSLLCKFNSIKGFGKDRAYSPHTVRQLFDQPNEATVNLLVPSQVELIKSTLVARNRIDTGLPESSKQYDGGWYYQGLQGTCAAWALAHGMLVQGREINVEMMTLLLNVASNHGSEDLANHGLTSLRIELLMAQTPACNFQLKPTSASLVSTKDKGVANNQNHHSELSCKIDGERVFLLDLLADTYFNPFKKHLSLALSPKFNIKHNAQIVKDSLDQGLPIYTVVSASRLRLEMQEERIGSHAVVIAGYRVKDGQMDLQIVDSALGIYWVSIEHFSTSLDRTASAKVIDGKESKIADYLLSAMTENITSDLKLKNFTFKNKSRDKYDA